MHPIAKKEFFVLTALFFAFIFLLIPALISARQGLADDRQIEQLIKIKADLEHFNNKHLTYPLELITPPFKYVVTEKDQHGALSWYLRTPLKNSYKPQIGFDKERGRNYYFRIAKEGNQYYYDICGGNFTCGVTKN